MSEPLRQEVVTKSTTATYNAGYHRYILFVACSIFVLLIAGALVTSNDAGLSVPDWPTSFGSIYRIPPLVGGVKFEHVHRMIAQFVGFLTIILAVWTQRVEKRKWMRILGWSALGTVIAQGILGGITVLFYLPPAVSTGHATLAQTFFCIVVSMALFTSRSWTEGAPRAIVQSEPPNMISLTTFSVAIVWVQLILGAAFRHNGMKWLPHIIGAVVVACVLSWTLLLLISRYRDVKAIRRPAYALTALLVLQLLLGISAFVTRVIWGKDAPQPMPSMVWTTVAHVAVGALLLATSVVLAIQTRRYLSVAQHDAVTQTQKAVIA